MILKRCSYMLKVHVIILGYLNAPFKLNFFLANVQLDFKFQNKQTHVIAHVIQVSHFSYITRCFRNNESLLREGNFWVTFINNSNQTEEVYIYPYCPFDYCYPPTEPVYVNLNTPNGADAQCAFNRSGKLCGSCQDGLSLSLGSSRCMSCVLLIPFAIAGIVLVAFFFSV